MSTRQHVNMVSLGCPDTMRLHIFAVFRGQASSPDTMRLSLFGGQLLPRANIYALYPR